MIGRGAGKDGTIALESVALASQYSGIPTYDVDICANNEAQAMRPVLDIVSAFDSPEYQKKLKDSLLGKPRVLPTSLYFRSVTYWLSPQVSNPFAGNKGASEHA